MPGILRAGGITPMLKQQDCGNKRIVIYRLGKRQAST